MATFTRKMDASDINTDSKEIRLVLIGKTGGGKSAVGNTILGSIGFVSKISPQSVTQKTSWKEVTRGPTKIRIVDTPGIFDTHDIVKENKEWLTNEILKSTMLSVPGPHAFLYVLQIGRLTEEDIKTATKIFELFGEKVYDFVIIVFTHAHDLKEDNVDLKEYIDDLSEYFAQLYKNVHNRVICVDNKYSTAEEKQSFIDELLQVVYQMNKIDYYKNKTIEEATYLFEKKVNQVKEKESSSFEEAKRIVLDEIRNEGPFFKLLKGGSFGLTIAAIVGGLIFVFSPAGLVVAAGVAGVTGAASAVAMAKDKCCIM